MARDGGLAEGGRAPGWRPQEWWNDEFLRLRERSQWWRSLSKWQRVRVSQEEIIYFIGSDARERREIERTWRTAMRHWRCSSTSEWRSCVLGLTSVPEWFFDRELSAELERAAQAPSGRHPNGAKPTKNRGLKSRRHLHLGGASARAGRQYSSGEVRSIHRREENSYPRR